MSSYAELMNEIKNLQDQAKAQKAEERKQKIKEIKKAIKSFGIKHYELGFPGVKRKNSGNCVVF